MVKLSFQLFFGLCVIISIACTPIYFEPVPTIVSTDTVHLCSIKTDSIMKRCVVTDGKILSYTSVSTDVLRMAFLPRSYFAGFKDTPQQQITLDGAKLWGVLLAAAGMTPPYTSLPYATMLQLVLTEDACLQIIKNRYTLNGVLYPTFIYALNEDSYDFYAANYAQIDALAEIACTNTQQLTMLEPVAGFINVQSANEVDIAYDPNLLPNDSFDFGSVPALTYSVNINYDFMVNMLQVQSFAQWSVNSPVLMSYTLPNQWKYLRTNNNWDIQSLFPFLYVGSDDVIHYRLPAIDFKRHIQDTVVRLGSANAVDFAYPTDRKFTVKALVPSYDGADAAVGTLAYNHINFDYPMRLHYSAFGVAQNRRSELNWVTFSVHDDFAAESYQDLVEPYPIVLLPGRIFEDDYSQGGNLTLLTRPIRVGVRLETLIVSHLSNQNPSITFPGSVFNSYLGRFIDNKFIPQKLVRATIPFTDTQYMPSAQGTILMGFSADVKFTFRIYNVSESVATACSLLTIIPSLADDSPEVVVDPLPLYALEKSLY